MATAASIYGDIATRTGGDIYIGVVGPVRTGKSTFIKRFMDLMVMPDVSDEYEKERIRDELPQSGAGKSIMTTQPRFVPNEAAEIALDENTRVRVRMIDCVGYLVEGAVGHMEDDAPRMVRTPWYDYDIPFSEAAEIGTRRVITEHSTIGVVMTTDGSVSELPRSAYVDAEERVVAELKEQGKPFVIILNSTAPDNPDTVELKNSLCDKYGTATVCADVLNMTADQANTIIETVLMEFPLRTLHVDLPGWVCAMDKSGGLLDAVMERLDGILPEIKKMRDCERMLEALSDMENFEPPIIIKINPGDGSAVFSVSPADGVFYQMLSEECNIEIKDDYDLTSTLKSFSAAKQEYDRLKNALDEVSRTGYGLVTPNMDEMALYEPEIVRQGSRFGVRLRAKASGLHIIRVDTETEVSPLVGTEEQSSELAAYLSETFEKDPAKLWQTNLFGKPLYDLVCEGMASRVGGMPEDVRQRLRETVERVVNEGCNGLICILL